MTMPDEIVFPGLSEIRSAAELIYKSMPATPQYSWPLLNMRLAPRSG
jgi:threonine dehydratase